jgi:hypothetical protein
MWQATFELPDLKRDRLIALISTIETGLVGADAGMKSAFAELVSILSVGEVTMSHACPSCKRLSRTGASRCSYCWKALVSE